VVCISALLDILGTTDTGAQGFAMRAWRMLWRRIRGWWLVMVAAAAVAALAAVGRVHTGVWAAVMVAVGSAIAAVISERGRSLLADQAKGDAKDRTPVDLTTVAQLPDPIKLGVHPAAEVKTPEGHIDQVPPFIERDQLAGMERALVAGGFVLVVGDSTAGKTRLAYEAMRRRLSRHTCVTPKHPDAIAAAVSAAKETRPAFCGSTTSNATCDSAALLGTRWPTCSRKGRGRWWSWRPCARRNGRPSAPATTRVESTPTANWPAPGARSSTR
jgi:hypothetical protein